ncbi:MAG: MHYT domain-containing protein [Xanthobacteraceae bacterium]
MLPHFSPSGIWAMRFVGMLAAALRDGIVYLVFSAVISFLICAFVVGISQFFASMDEPLLPRVIPSAILMGADIASMHYDGIHEFAGHFAIAHNAVAGVLCCCVRNDSAPRRTEGPKPRLIADPLRTLRAE